MNHDNYAHCIDFTDNCPKDCFRAQLVRDLNDHRDKYPPTYPVSWMHLLGTNECKKFVFDEEALKKLIRELQNEIPDTEEYLASHPKAKKWIDEKIKELDKRWLNDGKLN